LLAEKQIELYRKHHIHDIFPEYWVIKVGKFGNRVKDKLDEWIYFFKNAEIKNEFSAKGLREASERLDEMKLNEKDAKDYRRYLKELRDIASKNHTLEADFQDLIVDAVLELWKNNVSMQVIAKSLKITEDRVKQIIENQSNK
jgi:hypothetical protein